MIIPHSLSACNRLLSPPSFACPLDLLHCFALSQLIHQLVQIADFLHQRLFDTLQLYAADAALYEHPVRIELRSMVVFAFESGSATLYSFTEEPVTYTL